MLRRRAVVAATMVVGAVVIAAAVGSYASRSVTATCDVHMNLMAAESPASTLSRNQAELASVAPAQVVASVARQQGYDSAQLVADTTVAAAPSDGTLIQVVLSAGSQVQAQRLAGLVCDQLAVQLSAHRQVERAGLAALARDNLVQLAAQQTALQRQLRARPDPVLRKSLAAIQTETAQDQALLTTLAATPAEAITATPAVGRPQQFLWRALIVGGLAGLIAAYLLAILLEAIAGRWSSSLPPSIVVLPTAARRGTGTAGATASASPADPQTSTR